MTIFRLNFLLKVGQMKVCQNPSFISTAMGTKMGPSYANFFVGYVEHQFFNQYDGPKPDLYGRYIDDCIGAISSSREELNCFITSVNSFHPALKYTWEISETSLAFLDIKVYQWQRFMY